MLGSNRTRKQIIAMAKGNGLPSSCWQLGAAPLQGETYFFRSLKISGSSQLGRCRRGRSEIPRFSSKLQLFVPCSRIKRKKAKKSAKKRGDSRQKRGDSRKKAKKKGRFPPAQSTPTPLRTSQKFPAVLQGRNVTKI